MNAQSIQISLAFCLCLIWVSSDAQDNPTNKKALNIAKFTQAGELIKPDNLDTWIHLGSNLGQGYNEELFDANNAGTFQIVEMEPNAYQYFKETGHYADGTMIALSFYRPETKVSPQLNGFSQGKLVSFEIHLIDGQTLADRHGFYNFGLNENAKKIEDESLCMDCHREEAAFDGTFTQFYPKMQAILSAHQ